MNGIVFFKTKNLERIKKFYLETVECSVWMDQGDCLIFQFGEFLFGFCQRENTDKCGMLTFFFPEKSRVDFFYKRFIGQTDGAPRDNPRYPIYHFFAEDPDGRVLEFQYFYNL
jgi:hypothetical protein